MSGVSQHLNRLHEGMSGWPWLMHWRLFLIVTLNIPKSHRESALGTGSPNRERLFAPGGKHEQNLTSPHCLRLAPTEEAAKFPIPQVDRNDPEGRKKCWGVKEEWPEWLREGNKCLHSLAPEQRAR